MASDVDSALLLRMEATLAKFERQMAKGRQVGSKTARDIQSRFDTMNGRISKSAEKAAGVFERHLKRTEGSYKSLMASLDPVEAATQSLAQAQDILNEALKRGVIDATQHAHAMKLVEQQHKDTLNSVANGSMVATRRMTGFMNVSKGGRSVMQNLSYQISDVAVQLEMGTDPARVMAQQGSQMAGAFAALTGPLGVVVPLLGTLAAIGIPVAAMLLRFSEGSEESAKDVETFADALDVASASIDRAHSALETASRGSADDLAEIYGEITDAVRELTVALADIEIRAAKVDMAQLLDFTLDEGFEKELSLSLQGFINRVTGSVDGKLFDAVGLREDLRFMTQSLEEFRDSADLADEGDLETIRQMQSEIDALQVRINDLPEFEEVTQIDRATGKVAELRDRLQEAEEAGDFAAVADAIKEWRDLLTEIGADQSVIDNFTQAESEARKLAKAVEDAKVAAEDLGTTDLKGGIESGVPEAQRLAKWMGIALEYAKRIAALGPQGIPGDGGKVYSGRGGDPRTMGGSTFDWNTRDAIIFEENYKPPKSERSGGGSKATPQDLVDKAQRQLDLMKLRLDTIGKTRDEIAALTFKQKMLNEAQRKGLDLDKRMTESGQTLRDVIDEKAERVGELARQYEYAKERAEFFETQQEAVKEGLLDAILEGENFADVLGNVAKAFARAALEAALFGSGPMAGVFGGGSSGGLLGGIFGSVFGGNGVAAGSGGTGIIIDGFREKGGPVKAGRAYVVGEERPELFVPDTNGTILPQVPSGVAAPVTNHLQIVTSDPDTQVWEVTPSGQRRQQVTAEFVGDGSRFR